MDPVVGWILRMGLAALFALSALHKARSPRAFAASAADYRLLPRAAIAPFVAALIAVEASVAVWLLVPAFAAAGALAAIGLLSLYSFAIAANLRRGRRDIDCGCLGPRAGQPLSGWLVVRNGLLAAGAALSVLPAGARPLGWVDVLSISGGAIGLALLFHAGNRLAALPRRIPDRVEAP